MQQGRKPTNGTYANLQAERDRLLVENAHLHERIANLQRQVAVWRASAENDLVGGKQRCADCRLVKPVEEFYRDRSRLRGYRSYCKVCDRKRYPVRGLTKPKVCA